MSTVIAKWGNSLALRLQRSIVEDANLREGMLVDVKVSGNQVVVSPARPKYTLDQLLAQMKKKRRRETDWGKAEGGEAW